MTTPNIPMVSVPSISTHTSSATTYLSRGLPAKSGFSPDDSDLLRAIHSALRLSPGSPESPIQTLMDSATLPGYSGSEELAWDTYTVTYSVGGVVAKKWSFAQDGHPVQWACLGTLSQFNLHAPMPLYGSKRYADDRTETEPLPQTEEATRSPFGPFTNARKHTKRDRDFEVSSRAVFIFLRNMGRIFLYNGVEYIFNLPFMVRRAWPAYPHGVIIQRVLEQSELDEWKLTGEIPLPTIFTLTSPHADLNSIGLLESIKGGFGDVALDMKEGYAEGNITMMPPEERVLWVSQRAGGVYDDLIVTVNSGAKKISVWRYVFSPVKDAPTRGGTQWGSGTAPNSPSKRASLGASTHIRPGNAGPGEALAGGTQPFALPLRALPGMAPALTTTTTMEDLMNLRPKATGSPQWTVPAPATPSGKEGLDINLDQLEPRQPVDLDDVPDPIMLTKIPAFWVEKLYTHDAADDFVEDPDDITIAVFDERWNGTVLRSLLGICFSSKQTLRLFSIIKQEDRTLAMNAIEPHISAISISAILATRKHIYDLAVLKPDGRLAILIHGTQELPVGIPSNPMPEGSVETTGDWPAVTAIFDHRGSQLSIRRVDGSVSRVSLNLMPTHGLTTLCLWMMSLVLPTNLFFVLHRDFLSKWSSLQYCTDERAVFEAWTSALYSVLDIDDTSAVSTSTDEPEDAAWRALFQSESMARFIEDPTLHKLKLPPSRAVGSAPHTPPLRKPHHLTGPVLHTLHQVAEDRRFSLDGYEDLALLVPLICKLAMIVRPEWADYWKRLWPDALPAWPSQEMNSLDCIDDRLPIWPPDLSSILYGRINNPDWSVPWVTPFGAATPFKVTPSYAYGKADTLLRGNLLSNTYLALADGKTTDTRTRAQNGVKAMVNLNISHSFLRHTPLGLASPLREAVRTCQLNPGGEWPISMYRLIGRDDLAAGFSATSEHYINHGYRSIKEFVHPTTGRKTIQQYIEQTHQAVNADHQNITGVELDVDDFTQIRFGSDRRLEEIARMLCSSTVPIVRSIDRPELSEHDQLKEQQHQAIRMAERTLALPLGRALFTFGCVSAVTRETFVIPKLEYGIRLQPQNVLVAPEPGKVPVECISWGEFNNGVAAGLRISPNSAAIDSSWIKFNKPTELTPEHAGFLYALGLTGHLRRLLTWHTFTYLTPKHDMTSIGVLLGLSAANMGNSNAHVTKLIAVHTPALLPTPDVDLNVPLITQAAGLMGIGLLYLGTKNRRMAEVCLSQISRRDLYQPDISNEYREAYTLSAALACGMVLLGKGTSIPADLVIQNRLRLLVHGEPRKVGIVGQDPPTFDVNLTSPAATIALGMMFLKTNRQDVADILALPDTLVGLHHIQPYFLMIRALARALIMFEAIEPTKGWLVSQLPSSVRAAMEQRFQGKAVDDGFELAYFNILAGAIFALSLKYAGTAREEAYLLIIQYYDMYSQLAYTNSMAYDHRIKRSAIREGLNLISICLNMVMAGTGEINCLRRLRYAYGMYNQPIRYGTHVSTHVSLGLLFLGGGRYTLGNSDAAIACMIAAFFPRFANVSSDNKSYLQAYRHLWVLAVEPRCLIARDVDTKEVVYLPVKMKVKEGQETGTTQLISPTLIPDVDRISSIRVDTPRYWPFYLDIANFERHRDSLLRSQTLYVKRRTAFLSYMEDPKGSRSLFVRSGSSTSDAATLDFPKLTGARAHPASDLHHFISSSANDPLFLAFADRFCRDDGETEAERLFQVYCRATLLDGILQDKSHMVQSHLTIFYYRNMSPRSQYFTLRLADLRFASDFYNKIYDRRFSGRSENNVRPPLIRENTLSGALHALDLKLEDIRVSDMFRSQLSRFVRGEGIPEYPPGSPEWEMSRNLSWYLQRNSIPASTLLVILKGLALQAHEQCLGGPPPQGTTDAEILDQGIKEVLHATGTQMTTAFGSGWGIRSLDEVISAWS